MAINLDIIRQWAQSQPSTELRTATLARIEEIGWPRARHEAWTYFPLANLSNIDFALPPRPSIALAANPARFELELSTENDLAALLPLALSPGTRHFSIAADESPSDDLALGLHEPFSHTTLELGANSKVRLLLPRAQDTYAFKSQRLDIVCGENSELELITTGESTGYQQVALRHVNIVQQARSTLRLLALHSGSDTYRGSLRITLAGEEASCEYRALTLACAKGQSHRVVRIDHASPSCRSDQFVRHILADNSHGSYDGSVHVGKDCPGTISHQLINSLLLSEGARASTKPNLKIFHDDVECTHGSTCSDLSSESMFYLRSRGIDDRASRQLLTAAFADEVVLGHPDSPARSAFLSRVHHELATLLAS